MKYNLSPTIMIQLEKLFHKKKWKIYEDSDIKRSLYKKYCERLRLFDEEGQELFIELSHRFEQVELVEYIEMFLMSFLMIDEDLLTKKKRIIISPLVNPYIENLERQQKVERKKTKSGQVLYYLLAAHDLRWLEYSSKFEFFETISDLKKKSTAVKIPCWF